MQGFIRRYMPWLGLFGPLPVVLGTIAAVSHYTGWSGEHYSFLRQAISDLGDASRSAWAGAFNAGMITSGLCMALFIVNTGRRVRTRPGYVITAAGVVATTAMMGIGVFTAEARTQIAHYTSAGVAFCGILTLSAGLSLYLLFARQEVLSRWLVVPSLFCTACASLFLVLLVATRAGYVEDARLLLSLVPGGPRFHVITTLEWSVLGSVLILCFVTALSLLRWPATEPRAVQTPGSKTGPPR